MLYQFWTCVFLATMPCIKGSKIQVKILVPFLYYTGELEHEKLALTGNRWGNQSLNSTYPAGKVYMQSAMVFPCYVCTNQGWLYYSPEGGSNALEAITLVV